nr:hypothetical protein [Tanacetum cinerariifolium]
SLVELHEYSIESSVSLWRLKPPCAESDVLRENNVDKFEIGMMVMVMVMVTMNRRTFVDDTFEIVVVGALVG